MSVKRWLLVGLVATILFATIVAAQDDDDEHDAEVADTGKHIEEVTDGIDAEDAAGDLADNSEDDAAEGNSFGVRGATHFLNYADLKVPAGQRVELVVPISSAHNNAAYEVAMVIGHLSLLDHSRTIQNFSAQMYTRVVEGGETANIKYSVTPDIALDPMEYAFVIASYLRNANDNTTILVTAFNGTMVVEHPLGFDWQGLFTFIGFFGSIGGGAYYYWTTKKASRPAARARTQQVETGTKNSAYDPEFVDKTHIAYVNARTSSGRNRSASK